MPKYIKLYALIILVFIVWGTQHPPIKILSAEIPPLLLNFLRFSIALIFLLPFVLRQKIIPKKNDMVVIMSLGIIGISLFGLLSVSGIKLSTATNSAILINSNPLLIAILAPFLIKEATNWKRRAGLLIGFAGVLLSISNGFDLINIIQSDYFTGNILLFASAFCIALYAIYNKKYIKKYGGLVTTFYALLGGTALLLLITISSGEINQIVNVSVQSYFLLGYVAIITTALTWVMWFGLINKIGVTKTGAFFFMIPISGILSSGLILREQLTIFTAIGTLLILIGVYIVQKN